MPMTTGGYVAPGMAPPEREAGGFATRDSQAVAVLKEFSPAWSWLPDPDAEPTCSYFKRDGSPCKAPPIGGDTVCVGHLKQRGKHSSQTG